MHGTESYHLEASTVHHSQVSVKGSMKHLSDKHSHDCANKGVCNVQPVM